MKGYHLTIPEEALDAFVNNLDKIEALIGHRLREPDPVKKIMVEFTCYETCSALVEVPKEVYDKAVASENETCIRDWLDAHNAWPKFDESPTHEFCLETGVEIEREE